ncbi:very short patch repair endonuclease [Luteimonas fraxinea]|uniref:Very short patch repair endonuclease n=1 Tax=Luteimonas fraxinea TaxID=2901869 RepID=A0ABS8UI96_9GAMM|nr:very short patch repair endonuclease [Luteimonas fraxinea]MCD9098215.1 very short patch repair endonuclease [Luteimonas fraxinea]MCD9126942.1 very short patch repair endonuclease [Luteimonas fraxinea]UHH08845.1 very short patch repair endonuclease [Luteimonas fraxinea]
MTGDELRSRTMRAVRSKDTQPELIVRRLAHALGFRFRLHRKDLPGSPDLVFPARKKVIFVNGCFWHGHDCARGNRQPKTNADYWFAKIARNKVRDARALEQLRNTGWNTLVLWECELKDLGSLKRILENFLTRAWDQQTPELQR